MAIISDALRQAFMPKHEYSNLREEDKAWTRVQIPIVITLMVVLWLTVVVSSSISLKIVFPADDGNRWFCGEKRVIPSISVSGGGGGEDMFVGTFGLTDEEAADFYWMVVFVPSVLVFVASLAYLLAGIAVAYSAPTRHGCLKVVENNYCASKRGGVRCLAIINIVFAMVFGLLAVFLGSSLLTLGNSCSSALFWCYEIASWSLVILYGGTAFFLRRKTAVILDSSDFCGRNSGLEMLESYPTQEVSPEVERRENEGFKTWMGSSLLSSDEEDGPDGLDDFDEIAYPIARSNSSRLRV